MSKEQSHFSRIWGNDMLSNELKPCPFCGQAARTWHDEHSDYTKHHRWIAGCQPDFRTSPSCPIEPNTHEDFKTEAEAIAAWNRRANSGGEVVAWIPVDERLPETCEYVQCFCREVGIGGYQSVGYLKNLSVKNDWIVLGDVQANEADVLVTHWMPLPAPPAPSER